MEKMSGGLHVKKMEHVGYKMYLKKKNYTSLLSSHPHALQQRQVGLDDDHDQILACQKIRSEWLPNMMRRRTLSLSFKFWEESLLALNALLFFIQHFPFLSDRNIKHNSKRQPLNYFSIQSNLDKMTVISLIMMTSEITLSTTAIATRYSTRYSDFLLLLDSK